MAEGSQNLSPNVSDRGQAERVGGRRWRWAFVYLLPIALGGSGAWVLVGGVRDVTLWIDSEPAGAEVYLDGQWRGTAPLDLDRVERGRHHLRLTKNGHLSYIEALHVSRSCRHVAKLKALPTFRLEIKTDPPGAGVQLHGRPVGKTPLVVDGLEPGALLVTIDKDGYEPVSQTVTISGGDAFVSRELVSKSEAYFIGMIAANPGDINSYTELAHHYMVKGQYRGAIEILSKGLDVVAKVSPGLSEGRAAGSSRFYQELHKIHRGDYEYGDQKAVTQMKEEMEKLLTQAIERHPECAGNYTTLVKLYGRGKNREKMVEFLREVAAKMPDSVGVQIVLGKALLQARRYSDAAVALERVVKEQPDNVAARESLASAFSSLHRRVEALEHLEVAAKLTQDEPTKLRLLNRIALFAVRTRDYRKAVEAWQQAIPLTPEVETACNMRIRVAYYCRRLKEYEQAKGMYEAVIAHTKRTGTRRMAERGLERLKHERR